MHELTDDEARELLVQALQARLQRGPLELPPAEPPTRRPVKYRLDDAAVIMRTFVTLDERFPESIRRAYRQSPKGCLEVRTIEEAPRLLGYLPILDPPYEGQRVMFPVPAAFSPIENRLTASLTNIITLEVGVLAICLQPDHPQWPIDYHQWLAYGVSLELASAVPILQGFLPPPREDRNGQETEETQQAPQAREEGQARAESQAGEEGRREGE